MVSRKLDLFIKGQNFLNVSSEMSDSRHVEIELRCNAMVSLAVPNSFTDEDAWYIMGVTVKKDEVDSLRIYWRITIKNLILY